MHQVLAGCLDDGAVAVVLLEAEAALLLRSGIIQIIRIRKQLCVVLHCLHHLQGPRLGAPRRRYEPARGSPHNKTHAEADERLHDQELQQQHAGVPAHEVRQGLAAARLPRHGGDQRLDVDAPEHLQGRGEHRVADRAGPREARPDPRVHGLGDLLHAAADEAGEACLEQVQNLVEEQPAAELVLVPAAEEPPRQEPARKMHGDAADPYTYTQQEEEDD
mmetsp:Transcript_112557/g.318849  ORF Transcript_112557/g.318849 Transcript_112557/m.318849 type:complete len:219 (+) Transcript_112557:179-835(+)